jgi:hypothetical protein
MSERLVLRHQQPAAEPERSYALPGTSSPGSSCGPFVIRRWLYLGAVLLYVDLELSARIRGGVAA